MKLFTVKDTKNFLELFQQLSLVLLEANLRIESEGVFLQSMDSACVILSDLKLEKSFFKCFNYQEGKNLEIGICLKSFLNILKTMDISSEWEFSYENNKLQISSVNKNFSLVLMDIEADLMTVEDNPYCMNISINTKTLKKIIKDILIHEAEDIEVSFNNRNIFFSSNSEKGQCSIILNPEDLEDSEDLTEQMKNLCLVSEEKYTISYGSKFLTKLIQLPDSLISLSFDKNMPLKIEYKNKDYSLKFFLAPKITDEEDF